MDPSSTSYTRFDGRVCRSRPWWPLALTLPILVGGCASSSPMPEPRTLVIHSGARLTAEADEMGEVGKWVQDQLQNIREDPSFLVQTSIVDVESYPWEDLEIRGDTVKYTVERTAADANTSYQIYAHLHLMRNMGRLEEWLPDADGLEPFELERAILERTADSWLYGRTVFDAQPYRPLDELIYARDRGWLDAYILTAQAERFAEERESWIEDNPEAQAEYAAWFREAFTMEPPGMREAPEEEPADSIPPADTTALAPAGFLP